MKNFIPYGRQWVDRNDIKAVDEVLKSDFITQGPKIEEFEKALGKYTGAKYAVVVSSGTAALHLAVAALEIKEGKEGITSANTFLASANCLVYNRLKPVLADIDLQTFYISFEDLKKKTTRQTKIIIPVDFAGQPAEMEKIYRFAQKRNIFVVEDGSHALGARYSDGSKVGSCQYADMTIFSFHPVKNITTGEGGAVTSNSQKLYEKLLMLRNHGITKNPRQFLRPKNKKQPWYYEMQTLGFNYRLTDIQAALGISQLKKLDAFVKRRRQIAHQYNQAFLRLKNAKTPREKKDVYSSYHLYVLLIDFAKIGKSRTQVMKELLKKNIGSQVHYIPLHLQPYYQKNFGYQPGDFPAAEDYYSQALTLPLYPQMNEREIEYVIKSVKEIINEK